LKIYLVKEKVKGVIENIYINCINF